MKRSKRSRIRGRRTCGFGSRKKHRGKGSKGGKGRAGTGKRAGHKVTLLLREAQRLGKKGFKSLIQKAGLKAKVINLEQIADQLDVWLDQGKAKRLPEGIKLELPEHKVLARGKLKVPLLIKAKAFSEKAKKKIEAAGGKAL